MKTLKDYIKLLEEGEPGPALRAVGVTPAADGVEAEPPVDIDVAFIQKPDGFSYKSVAVTDAPDVVGNFAEENAAILRAALKAGGVSMPDEPTGTANKTGIDVTVTNKSIAASATNEEASNRLLQILMDAGLSDAEGNPQVPQSQPQAVAQEEPIPMDHEQEQEVTEESEDAVSRVIELSKEIRKR